MGYGENIKKYRKARNLTQKELAEALGVATGTIQQYEREIRQPRLERIQEIAHVLGTHYGNLLNDFNEEDLAPDESIETVYKQFSAILPSGYDVYGENRDGDAFLKYPDYSEIEISKEEMISILDSVHDYIDYTLENLKRKKQK